MINISFIDRSNYLEQIFQSGTSKVLMSSIDVNDHHQQLPLQYVAPAV